MEQKNTWETYNEKQLEALEELAAEYRNFLDEGKTERECVDAIVNAAEQKGYRDIQSVIREGKSLKSGDKVYAVCMNKTVAMFRIGKRPMAEGMNILGAHIDSPRLDIKQKPFIEDGGFAFLDTHYYGGVKKYQWVALPLALHGVIVKKDGTTVEINVGENEDDPVFFVSDLLIHLAQEQLEKKASKVIEGEALDLIVGNKPFLFGKDDEDKEDGDKKKKKKRAKEAVKKGILEILKNSYDVEEEDFLSAELEIVPAGKARDMGFDRSMILAYGHDDRVCAYPSMMAVLDYEGTPEYTLCCIVTDKEEIGSVGATGMASHYLENTVAELYACTADYCELAVRRCLRNSRMLSSDVSAGYDPNFASAFEKKNSAFLGRGICFNKFTGSRGKSGSNDANPEFMASLRKIMDDAGVAFQTAELGRVDLGGGGTIAYLCAKYGMNVIDSGIPVLSMHAPYEVISKVDLYEGYRGYCAFLQGAKPVE